MAPRMVSRDLLGRTLASVCLTTLIPGAASVPLQYNQTDDCQGAILIWTR